MTCLEFMVLRNRNKPLCSTQESFRMRPGFGTTDDSRTLQKAEPLV